MVLSEALNDWLVGFGEGLGHAYSIDFGSHKLATMSPNRPNDSCLMVTKVLGLTPLLQTTLLKSQQQRGVVPLWGWAVGLLLRSFSNWNGHGSWVCIMFFQSPPKPTKPWYFHMDDKFILLNLYDAKQKQWCRSAVVPSNQLLYV